MLRSHALAHQVKTLAHCRFSTPKQCRIVDAFDVRTGSIALVSPTADFRPKHPLVLRPTEQKYCIVQLEAVLLKGYPRAASAAHIFREAQGAKTLVPEIG